MKKECSRLPESRIIKESGFSRSQIHQWRKGNVERKKRKLQPPCEQTVKNAAEVISAHPQWGGRKGQLYMLYHRKGFISMKAYEKIKQHVKFEMIAEASHRETLPGRRAYEHIQPERVGQIWAEDFTQLPVEGQAVKIAVVIDVYDQYILGWQVSERATASFVGEPVRQALESNNEKGPEAFLLSDNGSQYVSEKHNKQLNSAEIVQRLIPPCRPEYNGWVECGQKEFKNEFYNVLERRQRQQADEEKSLLERVRNAAAETVESLNKDIPRPCLNGVTPEDVHTGQQGVKVEALREYREAEYAQRRKHSPPWQHTFKEVLHNAVAAPIMTTKELTTKLSFFCRCPLRQIARLNLEGVG